MGVVVYDNIENYVRLHSKFVVDLIANFRFSENVESLQGVH
jgi:hypothetical protein